MTLEIHPLCAALRGEDLGHDMDELSAIQASMAEHGPIKGRIIVDADTGQVLDGWTFKSAWEQVAKTVPGFAERYPLSGYVQVREFASEDEKVALVAGMQLGRRNLEPAKRLAAVQRLVQATASGNGTASLTHRLLGKYASVGGTLIREWKRVNRRGVPELKQAVEAGKVSTMDAYQIAELPASDQSNIVASGVYAIRKTAKRLREDKSRARKARALMAEGAVARVPKGPVNLPVDVLDALDTVARWWNATGRRNSERADAIRAAVLISFVEASWKAATFKARKEFVAAHWKELLGLHNSANGKGNGHEAFDKLAATAVLERMKRNQPQDADVAAVAQWFEMMMERL